MSKDESPLKKAVKTVKAKAGDQDSKIQLLEEQVAQLTEALQRERADATNVRRRADEERLKLASYFKAKVIQELLPSLDNLDRALKHSPLDKDNVDVQNVADWAKGVIGIQKQITDALTKLGVEKIATVGEVFNPEYHEAIAMEEGDGATEVVCEELQAGYRVGDEVIRHAMVKVKLQ